MKILWAGSMGRLPFGGYSWMDMQWLAGLQALGHDVHYLEDCGEESWVYNWTTQELTTDLDYPAGYVESCLRSIGLGDRWTYRTGEQSRGLPVQDLHAVLDDVELLVVHGVPLQEWRPHYLRVPRRAFIDVDPGFVQISAAKGDVKLNETLERCERLFTIAQRIGQLDCPIPTAGREWIRVRPPVALQHWPRAPHDGGTHFSAVMQWRGFREVEWDGVPYGQKDMEFPRFMDLPRQTSQPFRVALTGAAPESLSAYGWEVLPGWEVTRTPWTYQDFIRWSRAELGVAKHGYVAMRGGWFSDRSVCYLASGRPVLVQDTGLADWLPVGQGVLTFTDVASALAGIDAINSDYEAHCSAARAIAEEHFAADRVVPLMLESALG